MDRDKQSISPCPLNNMELRNLWSSLFGSGKTDIKKEPIIESHTDLGSAHEEPIQRLSLDEEMLVLARECGGLSTGKTIEISLHRILELCPRERKKADAYLGLKRKLKDEYGVYLVITSRTGNNKEDSV